MVNPAKGLNCDHVERVELKAMLEYIRDTGEWKCVFCKRGLSYSQIYVDKIMRQALAESEEQTYAMMLMVDNSVRAVKHLSNLETTVMMSAFTIAAKNLKAKRNKQSEEYIGLAPTAELKSLQSHFISRLAAKAERTKQRVKGAKLEHTALSNDPRYKRKA
jgi:hypothetical protein